jgi:NAD(P)-dependent dehydrogenase (short-subunit alcohol dehydrogenase family)
LQNQYLQNNVPAGLGPAFDLANRVAVVLGGTSGIGRSIGLGLSAMNARVVPVSRDAEKVREAAASMSRNGYEAPVLTCDVTKPDELELVFDCIVKRLGGIQILVNSAGAHLRKSSLRLTSEEWDRILDLNLKATFFASQRAAQSMIRQGAGGSIINIASLGSFMHFKEASAYCISKAGVLQLTKSLAAEWAPYGIRVNAIVPGVFPTELNAEFLASSERSAALLARTPMGRFGRLDELQGVAAFLASDAAAYVTGTAIPADGGFLANGI